MDEISELEKFRLNRSADLERVNSSMIYNAIKDAGLYAYGTVGVEVWVLDRSHTSLVKPTGGFWVDEVFKRTTNEDLLDLSRSEHSLYGSTDMVSPGVGLSGALWAESSRRKTSSDAEANFNFKELFDLNFSFDEESQKDDVEKEHLLKQMTSTKTKRSSRVNHRGNALRSSVTRSIIDVREKKSRIVWRDISALADDPFQPANKRLQVLAKSGFGLAAGVTFQTANESGIVVYLARKTVDIDRLQSYANEQYLVRATDLIGAVWSLQEPRSAVLEERKAQTKETWRRVRTKILALVRMKISLENLSTQKRTRNERPTLSKQTSNLQDFQKISNQKLKSFGKKCLGANVPFSPNANFSQALFISSGSFLSLLSKFFTFFRNLLNRFIFLIKLIFILYCFCCSFESIQCMDKRKY